MDETYIVGDCIQYEDCDNCIILRSRLVAFLAYPSQNEKPQSLEDE